MRRCVRPTMQSFTFRDMFSPDAISFTEYRCTKHAHQALQASLGHILRHRPITEDECSPYLAPSQNEQQSATALRRRCQSKATVEKPHVDIKMEDEIKDHESIFEKLASVLLQELVGRNMVLDAYWSCGPAGGKWDPLHIIQMSNARDSWQRLVPIRRESPNERADEPILLAQDSLFLGVKALMPSTASLVGLAMSRLSKLAIRRRCASNKASSK